MMTAFTPLPDRPPPKNVDDRLITRVRATCFSSVGNSCLTLLSLLILWWLTSLLFGWAVADAVFTGEDRETCAAGGGMCWPFVFAKLNQWFYGSYPAAQRWRVDLTFLLLTAATLWLVLPRTPHKRWVGIGIVVAYPIVTYGLLYGGLGLEVVETSLWGGVMLTMVIAITGNIMSLPLAVLLALGRRAKRLPVVRTLCIVFIEFIRGVPLITMLFMAAVMLPLFMPEGATVDKLMRALLAVTLFQAAYLAEVVRGGLQALSTGQEEGAQSLGLSYWPTMRLIILPQALKICIPGVVNSYIALFKDTTLVLIIGLFDILGMVQLTTKDPKWIAPTTVESGYLVVAIFFWILCFGLSRYSRNLERKLSTDLPR